MEIREHATAAAFLARAGAILEEREAEHNLLLGVAGRMAAAGGDAPPGTLLLTVEEGGKPVAALVRQPGFRATISRGPAEAVDLLADAAAARLPDLQGVVGPDALAGRFAARWRERLPAVAQRDGLALRVHELRRLTAPPAPGGAPRAAVAADVPLLAEWTADFLLHTNDRGDPEEIRAAAERTVAAGHFLLWEDPAGRPVSMAARTRETPRGAGVSRVYTPAAHRGRGYGAAVTGEVTRRILASGKEFCFLFTDLANPTSNAIYARLGYGAVADWREVLFSAAARSP